MTLYGMMIAAALILSYVESQIPAFFAFPGMKLGLTNVVVVLALYKLGGGGAAAVNILRIVLVSALFGGPAALIYSLAGGMLSTAVMIILKRLGFRSLTVSIAGGVSHNAGQMIAAMIIMNTAGLGWYLAVLWFTGMITGALIGVLGGELIKRLPDKLFDGGKG